MRPVTSSAREQQLSKKNGSGCNDVEIFGNMKC